MIDHLSSLIGARRRELGLGQQQLAEAAGVSRTTLSHLEHGKAPHAQMDVVERILRALELSPQLSVGTPPDSARLAARAAHQARLRAQRERRVAELGEREDAMFQNTPWSWVWN